MKMAEAYSEIMTEQRFQQIFGCPPQPMNQQKANTVFTVLGLLANVRRIVHDRKTEQYPELKEFLKGYGKEIGASLPLIWCIGIAQEMGYIPRTQTSAKMRFEDRLLDTKEHLQLLDQYETKELVTKAAIQYYISIAHICNQQVSSPL